MDFKNLPFNSFASNNGIFPSVKFPMVGILYENLIKKYKGSKMFTNEMYDDIANYLINYSFHKEIILEDPIDIAGKVKRALPYFDLELKLHSSISLTVNENNGVQLCSTTFDDIIKKTTATVGIPNIKKLGIEACDERRRIFDCALLFIFYMGMQLGIYPIHPSISFYESEEEFIENYSVHIDFTTRDVDELEIHKLFMFTNLIKSVIVLVPQPRSKRKHFIDMIARIVENNSPKYISGSGASAPTRRRQKIYEVESGVSPNKRKFEDSVDEAFYESLVHTKKKFPQPQKVKIMSKSFMSGQSLSKSSLESASLTSQASSMSQNSINTPLLSTADPSHAVDDDDTVLLYGMILSNLSNQQQTTLVE